MKRVSDLTEPEVLALAVANEEEDGRIYLEFASRLRAQYPATAKVFEEMAAEESRHRHMLFDLFRAKHGETMPYITRQDVKGFLKRNPVWLMEKLPLDAVRKQAALMELQAANFYADAAARTRDVELRKLFGDLAEAEREHEAHAHALEKTILVDEARSEEDREARLTFLLQYVQPGLSGLIDGSVSTIAPIFAAAFATHNTWQTFLVGMAASIGAGISMGFTEALSDDGILTKRGSPWLRGLVCGLMTAIGGLGHTLPYLIPEFWTATIVAGLVAAVELVVIAWIRWRWMETPFGSAIVQVVLGGVLVLLAGIYIGAH
jgi:rubrerythrin